ncbi:ribosome assembly RNA-binding protein YhbY [Desulfobotulus sp. H1]|uniref:Ribosome assembly RNA-binding protein YhbY n=1 Tax=Desulfobotulus pelophilus TaxID=2823377 RepID=A0ABT3NCY3_9BACT|nr:ribosome assembly RNA-binding protein YhbY [Desulfobotulus pelophilus]MCW7754817.1 ribosome assembly RNA-binding protein YhbY [Desulfobotulus pelophilus]
MTELKGFQKQYLKGLAHHLKPLVIIGQQGITPALMASIEEALHAHELIKVRFNDFKEKETKESLTLEIIKGSGASLVSAIGHMLILYRPCKITEKRKIKLPRTPAAS